MFIVRAYITSLFFVAALLFLAAVPLVQGQVDQRPGSERPAQTRKDRRGLFHQLGLSDEQIRQIRKVNIDSRPKKDAARLRLREANRNMDKAIYADHFDPAEFELRLNEINLAQAALARINFENETAIRRILTPEQLVTFRELRARYRQMREEFEQRRKAGIRSDRRQRQNNAEGDDRSGGRDRPSDRRPF